MKYLEGRAEKHQRPDMQGDPRNITVGEQF